MKGKFLKGKKAVEYFYYPVLRFNTKRNNVSHDWCWWRSGWVEATQMVFQDALCLVQSYPGIAA